jgi:HPt (histidine-containing phosphotransfer) domain-containing protein
MLGEYVNGDKTSELVEYFGKEDFEYYRITVHAVKSTSLTIGATKVSEDAKALEMACKESNFDYVKQNHDAFLQEYKTLIQTLRMEFELEK